MKYFQFNIGDWLPATLDMSAIEEGIYCRLLTWYYSHEQPLPLTWRELNKIARCTCPAERAAVQRVVSRFFSITEDGWRHEKAESVLNAYAKTGSMRAAKREGNAARQRLSRQRREAKWGAVMSMGIEVPLNATIGQLDAVLQKHGITQVVTRDITCDVGVTEQGSLTCAPAINQEPIKGGAVAPPPARERARVREAGTVVVLKPAEPDRIESARRALQKAAFPLLDAHLADARFLGLLQSGATDDELRLAATEAVTRGKSWGWLIAVVAGRRADAAAGYGPGGAAMGRNRGDPDRVRGLTPTIAKQGP